MAHDSDDLLRHDAFELYEKSFRNHDHLIGLVASALRVTDQNETIVPDHEGRLVRTGYPTFCFKTKIVDEIGLYDSALHSADSEFIARLRAYYGKCIGTLDDCLNFRRPVINFKVQLGLWRVYDNASEENIGDPIVKCMNNLASTK